MKKLGYNITVTDTMTKLALEKTMAGVMRTTERLVCRHDYLVAKGWRAIVELELNEEEQASIDLQSNRGGGSFANVKMQTLKDDEKRVATGTDNLNFIQLKVRASKATVASQEMAKEICGLDAKSQLTKIHQTWMRDELGYTNFYGGVKVPFDILSARLGMPHDPDRGELRVAFSGASEEQDTMFTMEIIKDLQISLERYFEKEQFWFNLRKHQEIPLVRLWIDRLEIGETADYYGKIE